MATEIEIGAAAATVASDAMDAAEAASKGEPLDEASICERAGQALIARCNTIRQNEQKLAISFAASSPESFSAHRAAERLKVATEKAQVDTIEAVRSKVIR